MAIKLSDILLDIELRWCYLPNWCSDRDSCLHGIDSLFIGCCIDVRIQFLAGVVIKLSDIFL